MTGKPTYEELEQRVRELEILESERKQKEESLRSLNEHVSFYRNAVGSMEDYKIAVVGPDYRYRIVSPQYLKIYNLTGAEIVGRTVAEIMGDDVFEHAIKPHLDRTMKGRAVHYSDWFELSDKGKRYLDVSYYPVVDENQEVVSVIALSHDITEKRRVDEALRESEAKYRNLFENANEAIFVAQDQKLVFSNPKTMALTGYSDEELRSRPFIEFIHPDDREMVLDRHVRRLKGEKLPHLYSFRILHKDGSIRWGELSAVLINWNGKNGTLNFLSDITERKQAEEALEKERAQLRSLFEYSGEAILLLDLENHHGIKGT